MNSSSFVQPLVMEGPAEATHAEPLSDTILRSDSGWSDDRLGTSVPIAHVAELVAHARAETPFTVGIFGAAGTGKSHALAHMLKRIETLAVGGARATASPFLPRLRIARLSAPECVADPAAAALAAIHKALAEIGRDGISYASLAQEAALAATDPHSAAHETAETLDAARRRLQEERDALEQLDGRRARITETALYESGSSRVDAFARVNRGRIDARLRLFGFSGDPITTYKDLVRDTAEHGGAGGRFSAVALSFWAFGQARLIVSAILLLLLAWGCGIAEQTHDTWLASLRGMGESMPPVADWLAAHLSWFAALRQTAIIAAVLCLLLNVWRAVRFVSPLLHGARLLSTDLEARRGELDSAIAYQTRRVTVLEREVDAHAQRSEVAAKRIAEQSDSGTPLLTGPQTGDRSTGLQAAGFLAALERAMGTRGDAPQRIVVTLDDLDALPALEAATLLDGLHRTLARPGFVTILCADAGSWDRARLDRLVQIPLSVGGSEQEADTLRTYVHDLLIAAPAMTAAPVDPSRSVLDSPLRRAEVELLSALAPLAGRSPRALKRFVNVYRLARARTDDLAALALMLALQSGGQAGEIAAMDEALQHRADATRPFTAPEHAPPHVMRALIAANAARGTPITVGDADAARMIARDYRMPQ